MLPLPAATTTISGMAVTSQPVFDMFNQPMYLEVGVLIASVLIILIIMVLTDIPQHLRAMVAHRGVRKFDDAGAHRDSEATSAAIKEHNRFKRILAGGSRISRYD